jgi:hypothetical protein
MKKGRVFIDPVMNETMILPTGLEVRKMTWEEATIILCILAGLYLFLRSLGLTY